MKYSGFKFCTLELILIVNFSICAHAKIIHSGIYNDLSGSPVGTVNEKYYHIAKEGLFDYRAENFPVTFELGIRDEFIIMLSKEYNVESNRVESMLNYTAPVNLHLSAGLGFLDHYKIDFRIGLTTVDENFWGLDEGIYFEGDIIGKIYGMVGIDFFYDNGSSHNSAESGGSFKFYSLGLGCKASKNFSLDLSYCIPNEKIYGYNINTSYFPFTQTYNMVNNGLIKLGCQYSFIF